MRIIFLNIWHAQIHDKLFDFIQKESAETDIFCFVEVNPKLEFELERILPKHKSMYEVLMKTKYLGGVIEGQSIFIKNGIHIIENGKEATYEQTADDAGCLQFAKLAINDQKLFVGNIHGKAQPGDKLDTDIRIRQSEKILNFFKDKDEPKIIGGDFNLMPETKSIKMFEEAGYRNLIKEYKIKNTRNKLAWKQFSHWPNYKRQYFADYVFISSEVKVGNFSVPQLEISDHEPLILDFGI
jgi:exonuclease III